METAPGSERLDGVSHAEISAKVGRFTEEAFRSVGKIPTKGRRNRIKAKFERSKKKKEGAKTVFAGQIAETVRVGRKSKTADLQRGREKSTSRVPDEGEERGCAEILADKLGKL